MSSAKGFSVVYLGILPLPDLVGKIANWAWNWNTCTKPSTSAC